MIVCLVILLKQWDQIECVCEVFTKAAIVVAMKQILNFPKSRKCDAQLLLPNLGERLFGARPFHSIFLGNTILFFLRIHDQTFTYQS
jgi:hypothetical protein